MHDQLQFAQALARQAGEIMRRHFKVGVSGTYKLKEGNSLVTAADTEINRLVIAAVKAKYPRHAIIGEEASHLVPGAKYSWVCDPLDGTRAYGLGMPTNVFSLTLTDHEGRPILAVVYDPHLDREYSATKGGGAFLNGNPLRVNHVAALDEAFIGISGRRCRTVDFTAYRSTILADAYHALITSSCIYEAMLIASGQIAASIVPRWHAYDAASSKLIIEEAGGRVTDLFGHEQRYDQDTGGAIISNGAIHDTLVELSKRHRLQ